MLWPSVGNNAFVEDHGDVVYIWQNVRASDAYRTLTATFRPMGDLYERFTEVHVECGYYMPEVIHLLGRQNSRSWRWFEPMDLRRRRQTRGMYVARRI